ncbi:MAG: hypothetical protein GC179_08660 [Anaerolineaceae bacterium]|nr:hypothetical protein [Anaerolineaceae bacterium]
MAQNHDERMKDLSSELIVEYLKHSHAAYERVENLFERFGGELVDIDEYVVVTVYRVKKTNEVTVREAAGLTARSSVNRCPKCGKPL